MGTPRLKRQGREADHSPPPSDDVNNVWIYTSTPPVILQCTVLNYARDTSSWRGA